MLMMDIELIDLVKLPFYRTPQYFTFLGISSAFKMSLAKKKLQKRLILVNILRGPLSIQKINFSKAHYL
jgi:hypothetical protein